MQLECMQLPLIGAALSEAGAHRNSETSILHSLLYAAVNTTSNLIVHVKQKRMNRSMFKYLEFGSWIY
jgi:hypothetical protein